MESKQNKMNGLPNLIASGLLITIAGAQMIVMGMANNDRADGLIIPMSLLLTISGVLSIIFARANSKFKIPSAFQIVQGIGLIVYAIAIFVLSENKHLFLLITGYFIMLYGFVEATLPFAVLNSSQKIPFGPLVFRIVAGTITAIGALVLILNTSKDTSIGIQIAGILTMLIGISNLLFANKMKKVDIERFLEPEEE